MKILGKTIILKSIDINDSIFIYKLRRRKKISNYLHKPPQSIFNQRAWIKKNLSNKNVKDFIIIDKKNNKKIGTIAFDNIKNKYAEWGRWICTGNSYQNIEAVVLLLDYGFKKLKLNNIYSLTNYNNKSVVNFHKSTNAKYSGYLKSYFIIKNKKTDAVKYSFNIKNFKSFKKNFDIMTQSIQL